jgi:hypothetical protein
MTDVEKGRIAFKLCQLIKDPRTGGYWDSEFGTYSTLAEAKQVAKSALKDVQWVLYKVQVVDISMWVR